MESALRRSGQTTGPGAGMVVRRLGRIGWRDARLLQERAARRVEKGGPDELLLLEHSPVVTIGRGGGPEQLHIDPDGLRQRGVDVVEADRGGGVTYHGPGQLVGYPIIDLRRRDLGVRTGLRVLEAGLCRALRDQGVEAGVRPGLTGVWVGEAKVAAIGIGVRRGVTRHGFALNVEPEPEAFGWIRPCGLDLPVTSLEELGWRGDRAVLCRAVSRGLARALRGPGGGAGPDEAPGPRPGRADHDGEARKPGAARGGGVPVSGARRDRVAGARRHRVSGIRRNRMSGARRDRAATDGPGVGPGRHG